MRTPAAIVASLLRATLHLGLGLSLAACCATSPSPAPEPEPIPPHNGPPVDATGGPGGKRAPRSDAGVTMPESGFWERHEAGFWTYDLGVGLTSDVQLVVADADGRGAMRVALPPGATGAIMLSFKVMWARNDAESDEPPASASGTGIWHIQADENGRPGKELAAVPVTVDGATAAPLDDANDGTSYDLPHPVEVPATFWMLFQKTGGDPRIGAMRLTGDLVGTYKDLYYLATPDAPLGEAKTLRPYIAIEFSDLGK
ncbi:MAG: hypothetical protein U1F43_00945 [Myxococcota bacterium]